MNKIITDWDDIKQNHPNSLNLIELIEQQVIKTPQKAACYFANGSLTFLELNEKANQLAHFIKMHIDGYDNYIIIHLDRTIDSIISILAILKSGNIYVPIDINSSSHFLQQVISDCAVSAIITTKSLAENFSSNKPYLIHLNQSQKEISQMPKNNLHISHICKLAYVLYTSGTTGLPKGVKISQKSLINLLFAMQTEISFNENERFLAITPITFDISAVEFYLPLMFGASFVFADTETRYNPIKIIKHIEKYAITLMQATPITWQMLINHNWQNPHKIKMLCGGEGLNSSLASKLINTQALLWNFYGPTETTIWSTAYKVSTIDKNKPLVSIGRPIANTKVFILDNNLNQVPVGINGELYIGGDGVAEEYVNRPELNNTKFIHTKFTSDKLYKTGDIVYIDKEKQLHFVGRIDTQIKIRGHRVEVGAIENIVIEHPAIQECVVIAEQDKDTQILVAYVILNSDIILEEINSFISEHIYTPILPSKYIILSEFPLTAHGKIDRDKISLCPRLGELKTSSDNCEQPENKLEKIISEIISNHLKNHDIPPSELDAEGEAQRYSERGTAVYDSVHRDSSTESTQQSASAVEFQQRSNINPTSKFQDLGLHSIVLVDLANAINDLLNLSISVIDLINYPTIRSFTKFILNTQNNNLKQQTQENKEYFKKTPSDNNNEIAIIGIACKFPSANNYNEFWDLIINKKNTISFFNQEELINSGIDYNLINDEKYVPARGILDDIDKFDANFFNISPAEAKLTDPQHRIILEQSWTALEDAGYIPDNFPGKISVFVGMNDSSYLQNQILQNQKLLKELDQQQIMLATSPHYLATKISYKLGLSGPSMTVSTACSTGLVSVNMAVENLREFKSDLAIAGAINITLPQKSGYLYRELGIFSPDGKCNVFSDDAQGTVISNGVGVVVLKRLNEALRDNDNIIAIIKGSAINNDGDAKSAFTAPSIDAQAKCIQNAIKDANIDASQVEFIEAHGTGTIVGDPIEIAALTKGYTSQKHKIGNYCAIGSVKSNIGHTDTASGVAGLIKASLALYHKTLPANINYKTNNQQIDFDKTPFYVNIENSNWITQNKQRFAGVNSLGFGGTNAHMILQEAPNQTKTSNSKSANILIISAKVRSSLNQSIANIKEYLINHVNDNRPLQKLADCAYTLQLGRKHFSERFAVAFSDYKQLIEILNSSEKTTKYIYSVANNQKRKIIFGFVGQGPQYTSMGYDLYIEHPIFREIVDNCFDLFKKETGFELKTILFPTESNIQQAKILLTKTEYAQPALFIIEYALAKLLISLGVKPDGMIGHSLGEYVAAAISEVFSLNDAIKLIIARSKLMAKTKPGVMLAIPLATAEITPYLNEDVDIAAQNAPNLCVLSGSKKGITNFIEKIKPILNSKQLNYQYLHTSRAFHSQYMDPILDEFLNDINDIKFNNPQIPFVSNISGDWITAEAIKSPHYWATHMRNSVLFSDGIASLDLNNDDIFIEIGPGKTLTQIIEQYIGKNPKILNTLPHFKNSETNSYLFFLTSISKLWLLNTQINWEILYNGEIRKRIKLPTYPFAKQSHWLYSTSNNIQVLDNSLFIPSWQRTTGIENIKNIKSNSHNTWIIFSKDKILWDYLKNQQQDVYHVLLNDTFSQTDEFSYTINPKIKKHFVKLLNKISKPSQTINIVHSILTSDQLSTTDILYQGPFCLLYLSQAFSEVFINRYMNTLIITQNLYSVLGTEEIVPVKACILGPCKVIPQEQQNIKMKLIDVTPEIITSSNFNQMIVNEIANISSTNYKDEIAYRGNFRWIQNLQLANNQLLIGQQRLKVGGTYLITGGLGGIGLTIAEFLAKEYKANIILISRTATINESKWQNYIDDITNIHSPEYQKIKKLLNIKNHAKSLDIYNISITKKIELSTTINAIKQKYLHINGVIHAAGLPGMGVSELKTLDEYTKIIEPKLYGTEYLFELLSNEKLDFFALFSSITAITGFPGQIDYCSANRILDAYATQNINNFKYDVFCVTINWQAWRTIGMAAESKSILIDLNETNSISPNEGCELFRQIINGNQQQVIVSNTDLTYYDHNKLNLIPQIKQVNVQQLDSEEQHTFTINILLDIWKNILGISKIAIDDDFYELGGNSLLAISLIAKIRSRFTINIPSTILFKERTIRAIANIIEKYKNQTLQASPLVQLSKEIKFKPSIFLIHPIGGTVFCYLELANALKLNRSIYAIQDPSIEYQKVLFRNIEEQAAYYRTIIQKVQKNGPYYLCGASYGASLAMEIAHQLEKDNEKINFIGLIDGWGYIEPKDYSNKYIQELINIQNINNKSSNTQEKQQLFEELVLHRLHMLEQHTHKLINTKINLFKATNILPEYQSIDREDNHWSSFSHFPVNIFPIPGDHNTILEKPNVIYLAEAMNTELTKNSEVKDDLVFNEEV